MTRFIGKTFFVAMLLLATAAGHAQNCDYWPAPCPEKDYPNRDRVEDSLADIRNLLFPPEITMQNRLRDLTGTLVERVARQQHWEVVELEELQGSGFFDHQTGIVIPYERHPPHWFTITYEFILSRDSLRQWKAWLENFGNRRAQEGQQYQDRLQSKQGAIQSYMDSAMYYSGLKSKYMTDHAQEYQQALLSNNKAGIAAYEKGAGRWDAKINAFTARAAGAQQDPRGEQDNRRGDDERRSNTIRYHDATVLLAQFYFNLATTDISETPTRIAPAVAGAALSCWYDSEPDLLDNLHTYTKSRNVQLLLFGGWLTKRNADNRYQAAFTGDKTAADSHTVKKIKAATVQTIAVFLSGNRKAIQQCVNTADWKALNAVVMKP